MNFKCLEDISSLKEIVEPDIPDNDWNDPYIDGSRFPSSSVAALIFCTFLWLNTLLLIITVLNVDKVYSWLEE